MPIEIGSRLPNAVLREKTDDGVKQRTVEELVRGRRVVIIGLPGAFTPTCSSRHVPSYLERAAEIKAKGVDEIFCISVNDAFVMDAWAKSLDAHGKIRMLADGNAEFTRAIGLESDRSEHGMGLRSQRYSMYVEDGVVRLLNVEAPGQYEVSDAAVMLSQLAGLNSA